MEIPSIADLVVTKPSVPVVTYKSVGESHDRDDRVNENDYGVSYKRSDDRGLADAREG